MSRTRPPDQRSERLLAVCEWKQGVRVLGVFGAQSESRGCDRGPGQAVRPRPVVSTVGREREAPGHQSCPQGHAGRERQEVRNHHRTELSVEILFITMINIIRYLPVTFYTDTTHVSMFRKIQPSLNCCKLRQLLISSCDCLVQLLHRTQRTCRVV